MEHSARLEVLRGSLPIAFHLAQEEIAGATSPPPFFHLTPRVCYLSQLVPALHKHFSEFLVPGYGTSSEPWFEFASTPLDWRVPVGTIFDFCCAPGGRIPCSLTVHFTAGVPAEQKKDFIITPSPAEFKAFHRNSLKQALWIFQGHAKSFANLASSRQHVLETAITKADVKSFDSVWISELLGTDLEALKRVPVRVYLEGTTLGYGKLAACAAKSSQGEWTRLGPWLRGLLVDEAADVPIICIVQGVVIDEEIDEVRIALLAYISTSLDGFLHLVVKSVKRVLLSLTPFCCCLLDSLPSAGKRSKLDSGSC